MTNRCHLVGTMKLRTKTLVTVGAVLTVMSIILVITASDLVTEGALGLERQKVQEDTRIAMNAVRNMEDDLGGVLGDWASWDDAYNYILGTNPDFADINFIPSTYLNIKLNYILVFDNDQNLVFSRGYDYENGEDMDVSLSLVSKLVADPLVLHLTDPTVGQSFLMGVNEGIAMVAVHPITDSAMLQPVQGYMVMARLLGEERMSVLSRSLMLPVTIVKVDGMEWDELNPEVRTTVLDSPTIPIVPVNDSAIMGYGRLTSNSGEVIGVLTIVDNRDIYHEANRSVQVLALSLLIVSAVFCAATLLVVDRLFMRRVSRLSEQVSDIGLKSDVSQRIVLDGEDELADLARETNKTLDALQTLELELRESERRYRAIVNDQSEMIFRAREDGVVTFINDAMAKELQRQPAAILGKQFPEILPGPLAIQLQDHVAEAVQTGKAVTREYSLLISNKGTKWYSWTVRGIIDKDTRLNEVQGVGRDLTEQKVAEEALQEANKKLSLLASITRHDVMNQLTVAHGFVVIAKLQTKDQRVSDQLVKAEKAIQMIHGYLEFTKDYQRMGMVQPVWINLSDAVEKSVEAARSAGVNVAIDVGDYEISADPLVEKVFYNLVDNSLRHGGKVKEIFVSARERDDGLVLTFEDDGVGVHAEEKELIFEAGYGENTGFGLFLAREILVASGMTIQEKGTPGQGARFEIFIPKGRFRQKC